MNSEYVAKLLLLQFWQVTCVIITVGAIAKLLCKTRPHTAHLLWALVLAKCLTPPVWPSPTGVFSWMLKPHANNSYAAIDKNPYASVNNGPRDAAPNAESSNPANPVALSSTPQPDSMNDASPKVAGLTATADPLLLDAQVPTADYVGLLLITWLVGAGIYLAAALTSGIRFVQAIKSSSTKPADALATLADELAIRLGLR